MNRRFRFLFLTLGILIALVPAAVFAADGSNDNDLLLRINGPVTVGPNETYDNVVVISDNATIEGTITGTLVIVDGNAIITGTVTDDITIVRGTLTLMPTAQVGDVSVIRGTLFEQPGATVTGDVTHNNFTIDWWGFGVATAFIWLGVTVALLLAGLIFAAVAQRQIATAGTLLSKEIGPTLLAAFVAWIVMPILMILALFTLVGVPVGIGYFVFVLPVLWFLGYVVAGILIGRAIVNQTAATPRPYLAAFVGLLVLQVVAAIPWFGGAVAFVAGIVGSGVLLLLAWRAWRGPRAVPEAVTVATPAPAA